jgi:kinesin family protein 3/17
MNKREEDLKCKCVIEMTGARAQCAITNPGDAKAPPKSFTFDGAYFVDSTTENIYNEIAYPLVEVRSHIVKAARLQMSQNI